MQCHFRNNQFKIRPLNCNSPGNMSQNTQEYYMVGKLQKYYMFIQTDRQVDDGVLAKQIAAAAVPLLKGCYINVQLYYIAFNMKLNIRLLKMHIFTNVDQTCSNGSRAKNGRI